MMKYELPIKNATKQQLRSLTGKERLPLVEAQIKKQVAAHQHKNYEVDIKLTDGAVLKNFAVHKNVLRPEVMSSLYLARFLFFNRHLYEGKRVLDMGCGSGIQGVVMGLYGAKSVTFSDIAIEAIENTKENVLKYGLRQKSDWVKSDLFVNLQNKYFDLIAFNHPFFSELSLKGEKVDDAMIQPSDLLSRFFTAAIYPIPNNPNARFRAIILS